MVNVASIADDIADYLASVAGGSVGTVGTDIFVSRLGADLPADVIVIFPTGGQEPSHDVPDMREYTFQVFIRSTTYSAGIVKLNAVRASLQQQINLTLNHHRALFILAGGEGGHIGQNEEGQDEFSINFRCRAHST